ncbi:YhdT family protein [Pallidibacillus pasinlerensis]|uniref:YhdT family protein n=1 Tax=Pallidibacillus pasinlerensis TaxID=2703818 RepID=A0ABX0A806_9BACI|nr:YhdT family protein [Pallidibacillus pasinlerensis]NCU17318.1 YhdT family protein [Pallidibacillus pasinlerensis]
MDKDKFFSNDPRFKVAKKEAWIGVGLVLFNFVWWFAFAYGLGSKSPDEYTYILGFPSWFFYSCIGSLIVMSILVIVVVKYFFKDVPFEEEVQDIQNQSDKKSS